MSPEPICPNRCDWRCSDDGEGCIRRARNNSVGRCHVEIFVRPMRYKGCHQAHNAKVAICALFTTHNSLKLQGGDVPLFVEHCEAAVAEVDVTRRWLDEQGRHELSFSFDVLAERHGVPEVACAPSIVGSLLRLPACPPRSSPAPSRPIAIASRCGRRAPRCSFHSPTDC